MTLNLALKHLASINDETLPESTPEDVGIRYIEISDVSESGGVGHASEVTFGKAPSRARRIVRTKDVLVSTVRTYLCAVATVPSKYDGAVASTGFAALRARNIDPKFLKYAVLNRAFLDEVVARSVGISYPAINASELMRIKVALPDTTAKQRAIADYLDRETVRIDAFIAKNEQLIALLTERRAAIRGALAVGRNLTGPRRASGLFWAPDLPDDWEVVPLTSVAKLESGHTPSRTRPEFWREDECVIPWISLNDVGRLTANEFIGSTVNRISPAGLAGSSARMLPKGTVVLSRDATIGRSSIIRQPMATSQHFADWVCGDRLLPRYLWLLFTSCMQGLFDSLTNGSTIRTIGIPHLRSFRIPLPSLAVQAQIVDAAHARDLQLREAIETADGARKLAKERRSALISAAVTGQIDVKEQP